MKTILAAALTHIRHNHVLLRAVELDPETVAQQMHDMAALYDEGFMCSDIARTLYHESNYAAQQAHPEFGTAQREIARLLHIVAHNLSTRIRYQLAPNPVV